jgi:hypothetical protein
MTDGSVSDIVALQRLVPILRERADAGAADFSLTHGPNVARSTDETMAALTIIDAAVRDSNDPLTGIANTR